MKAIHLITALIFCALAAPAQQVTIVHTNDTHSQIDPVPDSGLGGVARRAALIDSIRGAHPDALLVDAGDAWQGSVFFNLFKGEVEQNLLNAQKYDIQILGNHEFDNGLEMLALQYANARPALLCTNYTLTGTPVENLFRPYIIKEVNGKRIGFFALNINPAGLIAEPNYHGVQWSEQLDAANAMAWYLKHIEKVDAVVALSHIGWDEKSGTNDRDLASQTRNIDLIIGGHSHTLLEPAQRIKDLDGHEVVVVQAKNKGQYVGEVTIDFDRDGAIDTKMHTVDARWDAKLDNPLSQEVMAVLAPYRHAVDSINSIVIGSTARNFPQGSARLTNLISDFALSRGEQLTGAPVDLAIMNVGGIRAGLPKGKVTQGDIMTVLPFNNAIVVMDIKGSDLLANFDTMATFKDGQGVSRGVDILFDPEAGKVISATLDGKPIDPEKTYRLATISYLANGGDRMEPLTRGTIVARSPGIIFEDLIAAFERGGEFYGKKLKGDDTVRMRKQ